MYISNMYRILQRLLVHGVVMIWPGPSLPSLCSIEVLPVVLYLFQCLGQGPSYIRIRFGKVQSYIMQKVTYVLILLIRSHSFPSGQHSPTNRKCICFCGTRHLIHHFRCLVTFSAWSPSCLADALSMLKVNESDNSIAPS